MKRSMNFSIGRIYRSIRNGRGKGEGRREGRANDNDGVTASGANHRLIVGESESWVHGREKEDSRKLYLFLL